MPIYHFLSVFIISFTVLLYEILISRIFSIIYQYNVLFIVLSISMALLGLGGMVARFITGRLPPRDECKPCSQPPLPVFFFFLYPVSMTSACVVTLGYFSELATYGMILIAGLPFVAAGILLGSFYWDLGKDSRRVFFFDTVGGAAGCLMSLLLVYMFGVINTVLFTACIASFLPLLFRFPKNVFRFLAPAAIVFTLIVFLGNVSTNVLEFNQKKLMQTDNALGWMLNHLKTQVEYMGHSWDLYSRCDLVKDDKTDMKRTIFINGGTEAVMLRGESLQNVRKRYRHDITYIPYLSGKNDNVLVLGAGGGRDVLLSLAAGAKNVTAVEINQGVFDMVKENSAYTGNIFSRPGVTGVREDGRTFIMKDKNKYDKIVLSLSSSYAFADVSSIAQMENYLYTQEAFDLFLSHLSEDGSLVIFINYRELMNKFVVASLDYFQRVEGISPAKALNNVVTFSDEDSYVAGYSFAVIVRKHPFDFDAISGVIDEIKNSDMEAGIIPHAFWGAFESLSTGSVSLADFAEKNKLAPSTDDSPYFMEVVLKYREKLLELSYYLIGCIAVFSFLHFIFFLFKRRNDKNTQAISIGKYFMFMTYFISSGVAFMLVEIALTKRFSFYLDYPQLNMVVILVAILVGCGSGALASSRLKLKPHVMGIILFLALLFVPNLINPLITATISLPLFVRCLLVWLFLFPVSFFLGMPFPAGIGMLESEFKSEIPWFWGINGIASVLGSVLSVVISMGTGFHAVFVVSALFYLVLAGAGYFLSRNQ